MPRRLPVVLAIAGLAVTGCRAVWVHPEADARRYYADFDACRAQGVERAQGAWDDCMAARGWTRTRGFRWQDPFARD
jgi:hypothetical protein